MQNRRGAILHIVRIRSGISWILECRCPGCVSQVRSCRSNKAAPLGGTGGLSEARDKRAKALPFRKCNCEMKALSVCTWLSCACPSIRMGGRGQSWLCTRTRPLTSRDAPSTLLFVSSCERKREIELFYFFACCELPVCLRFSLWASQLERAFASPTLADRLLRVRLAGSNRKLLCHERLSVLSHFANCSRWKSKIVGIFLNFKDSITQKQKRLNSNENTRTWEHRQLNQ